MFYFEGSSSYDIDGQIVEYAWDFGDSTHSLGDVVSHEYMDSGTFILTLIITDNSGMVATEVKILEVN